MKVGRNDPCACGSGRKYKTCCLGNVVDHGPCDVVIIESGPPCGRATKGDSVACALCSTRYRYCEPHHIDVRAMLREHVVLAHPESIDKSHFTQLVSDETQLATLRERARRSPERYGRLLEYVETRLRDGT